jgi:ATP citrate (pro-S)-lyase
MRNILEQVRKGRDKVLVVGNHPMIVQAMLDFDHLAGKSAPSVVGIVAGTRKAQKFFFGKKEVLIPCFKNIASVPSGVAPDWMLNLQSGRRTFDSTLAFFERYPEALGGHLFAENVPEAHATALLKRFGSTHVIAGPSGVGILVAGHLKLGAIGGIDLHQLEAGKLATEGSVAVVSTSGGMTNELIRAVAGAGKRVSFSISIGGDRFPVTSLTDVLSLAENDPATNAIVYFGELGGTDEYEIVEMLKGKRLTKPILCYVAGIIDEAFDEHMQFGHAKALVARQDESARAKRDALAQAGAIAPETFPAFLSAMAELKTPAFHDRVVDIESSMDRQKSILSTRHIVDLDAVPVFVKGGKLVAQKENSFARAALHALLGREVSDVTAAFVENIFELLIDHGGHVSGAVNTMVTARAGKDMVSSLSAGLLTVGPRFGGAVNEAARTWVEGVRAGKAAAEYVEAKTRGGELLSGIGHRKYRVGMEDPRVAALSEFASLLLAHPHYDFAREVEAVTTSKNGKLILNVDGVMAALLLDILAEKEGYDDTALEALIAAEFFNALFVIPRSVGFIAHFIEQKKNDEGLFRLPDELLFERDEE